MSPMVHARQVPWTPHRIPGLAWDFNPSRMGLADGAKVTSLTDFGPNGYHATQATEARQPTMLYDALNGLPGVNFVAAAQQYLDTAAFSPTIPQPTTIFLVAKTSGTDDYFFDGIDANNRHIILVNSSGFFSTSTAPEGLTNGTSTGEYSLITAVFNGASSRLRVDGAEAIGALGTEALGGIRLGANQLLSAARYLNGVIIRCIGYERLLTESEIARVEQYLVDETGVGADWVVTFPKTRHVFQREGATTDLVLEGTWPVLTEPAPSGIEARYKGGAWTDIGATIDAGGTWSGTLTGQTDGQGTLEVRRTDTPADTKSVLYVGVGDVFLVAGQSNAQGHFDNYQTYTHATLKAGMFRKTSLVPDNLVDPTSSNADRGTVWPPLATHIMADQSVPVLFITAAKGGSGLVDPPNWEPGRDIYRDCIAQVAASRVTGIKAILWYQGENEAAYSVTGAAYKTALSAMLDGMHMDFRFYLTDAALASDTFTAADGTTLNGRTPVAGPANWVVRSGTLEITGNQVVAVAPTPANPGYVATMDMGEENVDIVADLTLSGNNFNGFVFRYDPTDGSHYACRWRAPTGRMQLLFWDGVAYTNLGELGATIEAGVSTEVSASISGPNLKMRVGNKVLDIVDATENSTMTHHGIHFHPNGAGSFDNLVARTITGPPLLCTQIGRRTEAAGPGTTDDIRAAQAELPAEDPDVFAGPLCHDEDFADEVHWSTNTEAGVLAGRWWRAIEDALYGGNNGTGPTFASATEVDSTHVDVVFTFPGSATTLVLGASPTVGWKVLDDGVERVVSAVALQSATTLRLTLAVALSGAVRTVTFGSANESAGSTILDDGTYPLPPLPFIAEPIV